MFLFMHPPSHRSHLSQAANKTAHIHFIGLDDGWWARRLKSFRLVYDTCNRFDHCAFQGTRSTESMPDNFHNRMRNPLFLFLLASPPPRNNHDHPHGCIDSEQRWWKEP